MKKGGAWNLLKEELDLEWIGSSLVMRKKNTPKIEPLKITFKSFLGFFSQKLPLPPLKYIAKS